MEATCFQLVAEISDRRGTEVSSGLWSWLAAMVNKCHVLSYFSKIWFHEVVVYLHIITSFVRYMFALGP